MTTESKKLQTTLDMFDADPWEPGKSGFVWSDKAIMELEHDARLAHEMLAVIQALVLAIEGNTYDDGGKRFPTYREDVAMDGVAEALAAAAPFLEQED